MGQRLEAHLVAVSRGEAPERGTFCGNCFTPISRETTTCPHCSQSNSARRPVDIVPAPIVAALRVQRATEGRWVNGFAYIGVLLAMVKTGHAPTPAVSIAWATLCWAFAQILMIIWLLMTIAGIARVSFGQAFPWRGWLLRLLIAVVCGIPSVLAHGFWNEPQGFVPILTRLLMDAALTGGSFVVAIRRWPTVPRMLSDEDLVQLGSWLRLAPLRKK